MKEVGLSIALADQRVSEPGVEVGEVHGVLPGIKHSHLGLLSCQTHSSGRWGYLFAASIS